MEIRRPVAALAIVLALCGSGATVTGCGVGPGPAGTGTPEQYDPKRLQQVHDNLPNLSDPNPENPRNRTGD